jgi:hypothetical protein
MSLSVSKERGDKLAGRFGKYGDVKCREGGGRNVAMPIKYDTSGKTRTFRRRGMEFFLWSSCRLNGGPATAALCKGVQQAFITSDANHAVAAANPLRRVFHSAIACAAGNRFIHLFFDSFGNQLGFHKDPFDAASLGNLANR